MAATPTGLSGAATISQMRQVDVIVTGETYHWLRQRGFEETLNALARHRQTRFSHVLSES